MSVSILGSGTLSYHAYQYENKDEKRTVDFLKNIKFSEQYKKLFGINSDYYTVADFLNFDYQTNNYGFRDDDFSLNNSEGEIWCFGCSWTYGVGIIDRLSWPKIIQKNINITTKNFGVSGSGPETCLRLLEYWLSNSKHKPIAIYINGFFPGRFEFQLPNHPVVSIINSSNFKRNVNMIKNSVFIEERQKKKLINSIEDKLMHTDRLYEKCYNSIYDLLSQHKIEYKIVDYTNTRKFNILDYGCAGRDIPNIPGFDKALKNRNFDFKHPDIMNLSDPHPGVKAHKIMSDFFTR